MLPKTHRLVRERDFQDVLKERKGFREDGMLLKAKARPGKTLRFGIVAGKTVSARATQRNRFRRVVAEAIFRKLPELKEGYDLVIIGLPRSNVATLEKAEEVLGKLFTKASLLKNK